MRRCLRYRTESEDRRSEDEVRTLTNRGPEVRGVAVPWCTRPRVHHCCTCRRLPCRCYTCRAACQGGPPAREGLPAARPHGLPALLVVRLMLLVSARLRLASTRNPDTQPRVTPWIGRSLVYDETSRVESTRLLSVPDQPVKAKARGRGRYWPRPAEAMTRPRLRLGLVMSWT